MIKLLTLSTFSLRVLISSPQLHVHVGDSDVVVVVCGGGGGVKNLYFFGGHSVSGV